MKTYHFGQLVPTVNVFAHPRTGSHFFFYSLSALFDIVSFPHAHLHNREAIDRESELNPHALYALGLREFTAPFSPIFFNPLSTGAHGLPAASEFPTVVLIRDPIATAYSRYRADRDRWGKSGALTKDWLQGELARYCEFYLQALCVLKIQGDRGLLLRWEDSVAGPENLERLVAFTNHPPKLQPSFVWSETRFEKMVKPGNRTFYRSGCNRAWHGDQQWVDTLTGIDDPSFRSFGYPSIADQLASRARGEIREVEIAA